MSFLNEQVDGDTHLERNSEIARLQELLEQAEEQLAIANARLAAIDVQEPVSWRTPEGVLLPLSGYASTISGQSATGYRIPKTWIPLYERPKP